MKKADMMISARLEIHDKYMKEFISRGIEKDLASKKAFEMVTENEYGIYLVNEKFKEIQKRFQK